MAPQKQLSVVVPTYDETDNLRPLTERLFKAARAAGLDCDLLFADDAYALDASRTKLRDEFLSHRGCTDAGEIDELLAGAAEVEDLLRNNVVQGRRQEASGAFKFKVKGASGEDEFAHRAEPVDDLEIALAEAELEGKKS